MHQADIENQRIKAIQDQIKDLRSEIAVERNRINSLWWKFGILAGVISAVASKVFGSTFGSLLDILGGVL